MTIEKQKELTEIKVALELSGTRLFKVTSVLIWMRSSEKAEIAPPSVMIQGLPVNAKLAPAITIMKEKQKILPSFMFFTLNFS